MKQHTPLWILTVLLLVFLVGCNTQPQPAPTDPLPTETTVPPTTTLPPETEPPIDPYALYEEAAAAMPKDLVMAFFIDREIQVADLLLTDSYQQNITYLDRGTDAFRARVTDSRRYGDYSSSASETFVDGVLYASTLNTYFSDEMTGDEFAARYFPPVLLDSSLYETVEYDGRDTFTFSGATAPESWVLDGEAEILSAEGTAIVANGTIVEVDYAVTYLIGGTQITLEVEQLISKPDNVTIAAPTGNHSYRPVEDFDAIKAIDQAYGYLTSTNTLEASIAQTTTSTYASGSIVQQYAMNVYDIGSDPMFQVDIAIMALDRKGSQLEGLTINQTFRNNVLNQSENGGRATPDRSVSRSMMRTYCQQLFTGLFPEIKYTENAHYVDMGGIDVYTILCTEEFGNMVTTGISALLYGETDKLQKMSTSITDGNPEFYVSIDKYTGLPIAIGLNYSTTHLIYGREHTLSQEAICSFSLPALNAYETIAEEPPAEDEPEKKATPLLYHVTGPDGQELWLFGTIHVGDSRTAYLPQALYDAFAASDALALEFDDEAFLAQVEQDPSLAESLAKHCFYLDGTLTADHISDQQLYDDSVMMLRALGLYSTTHQAMKPYLWSQEVSNAFLALGNKLTANKGMETRLQQLAEKYGKPILEVESALSQLEMLTGYSDALQELLLAQAVYTPVRDSWQATHDLYELWCQGDEAALIAAIQVAYPEDTPEELLALYKEYDEAMVTARNKAMLDVAIRYLESGDTVFYAVGLGHLLSENGLVFTLREAGYTVELVTYE